LRSLNSVGKEKTKIHKDSRLADFLKNLSDTQEFVDQEFPHDEESNVYRDNVKQFKIKYPQNTWLRAKHIVPGTEEAQLFDTFELPDVYDSLLYGCHLYSALAVMAEYPSRIISTFTTF